MQRDEAAKERMFAHIEQWKASGLTQKAYCQSNAIAYSVFHYWYKLYRSGEPASCAAKPSAGFLPLQLPAAAGCVELCFANGHRLLFHQPVSAEYLRALVN